MRAERRRSAIAADLLHQRRCLPIRLDAQLCHQHLTALLVLGQRCAALPALGEDLHKQALPFFTPGFQRQEPPGIVLGRFPGGARQRGGCQIKEQNDQLLVQRFPAQQQPFLKGRGIGQAKAGQQFALIKVGRLGQARQTGGALCIMVFSDRLLMPGMGRADADQRGKAHHIGNKIGRIEGDGLAVADHKLINKYRVEGLNGLA